jgi:short-subunit dehydrogenase
MNAATRPLAVVTGASSGIGFHLARLAAEHGFDLVIAADSPEINTAAEELRDLGVTVEAVEADLAEIDGVDRLCEAVEATGRPLEALLANAGHGLGKAFLDQPFGDARHVIDTNITGTIYLVHRLGQRMRDRRRGAILITGSIAGYMPGAYQAVYNGSKAFIDSFSLALREELKESGVTVTCLIPGATETEFFARAGLKDTRMGQSPKDDAAMVAEAGFAAMLRGDSQVVSGWQNKLFTRMASMTPGTLLAKQHAAMAAPGTADDHAG